MEKKFFMDWDEDDETQQEEFINNILADEDLPNIRSLIIGSWGECWDEGSSQPIIDMFAEHAERFAHLESLFIGDMESEECEISWIQQGDYSRLYAALPNLKKLTIKGTQGLELGEIAHDKLEHLEIISGGTPCGVFASLQNSQLPALKTLIVYIGVEDYGFDASMDIVMNLASKSLFPSLTHLGLVNSKAQNEIARRVLESDILPQLEVLELSWGTLTDEGAEHLLKHADRLSHLKLLDLQHHYLTEKMQEKLQKTLPIEVDASYRNKPRTYSDRVYMTPMFTE
ncbi:cytoplasmic protein [Escherichia coli]|uniref:STM4015 family protein n=1 Tax=Escherichia TaxID=561 RepID=UPI000CF78D6B|nr:MULTISPECIES: STM4015 family protein [unclassified Escherichia]EGO8033106.1 cytoplasmic protein [Escherichia coli]EGO8686165.1 cytoplasmic protein [Escherichia coli]EGO8723472.1 cytoplasmic protein [Escherichia coli]EGP6253870.1 cytoplasmic protein [Escherichia coli]EHL1442815.1 STM4015 family protein [Escherichia coli]